jgi:hypothetical protein
MDFGDLTTSPHRRRGRLLDARGLWEEKEKGGHNDAAGNPQSEALLITQRKRGKRGEFLSVRIDGEERPGVSSSERRTLREEGPRRWDSTQSMETAAEKAHSASATSGDAGSDAVGGLSASEARPPGAAPAEGAAASSNTVANTSTQSRDGSSSTRTVGERRVRRRRAAGGAVSRPPERSGWVELREEKERLAFIESKNKGRMDWRWLVLKDCRLRVYKTEEEARIEPETAHIISCDMRGSVCCHDAVLDRTLSLETGALTSTTRLRRVLTIRADTEEAAAAWIIALSQSSMWESVLRAAVRSPPLNRHTVDLAQSSPVPGFSQQTDCSF